MTIVRRLVLLICIVLTSCLWVQSQPAPGDPPSGDPDAVPITGLEYLLIAGGAYGASRMARRRKEK